MYTLSELYTHAANHHFLGHRSCSYCIYHSRENRATTTASFSADNTSDIVDSAAAMLEIAEKSCFTMPDGGR